MILKAGQKLIESGLGSYTAFTTKDTYGSDVSVVLSQTSSGTTYYGNWRPGDATANPSFMGNDIRGSLYWVSNGTYVYYGTSNSTSYASRAGVIFGDGDTAVTENDYNLAGNMITEFTATTTISTSATNGKVVIIATYNITNTSASPLIIKEIALRRPCQVTGTTTPVLILRDVFAEPITIGVGDTGVITYKLELS